MCAHYILCKFSLKSFYLLGNFFTLWLSFLRFNFGPQCFISLFLSFFFFFFLFLTKDTYITGKLNCGNPKLARRIGKNCECAFCLHFPFPSKAFVLAKKEIGVFGQQLAFQEWTCWSNLVRALSTSQKMTEKSKAKAGMSGKANNCEF